MERSAGDIDTVRTALTPAAIAKVLDQISLSRSAQRIFDLTKLHAEDQREPGADLESLKRAIVTVLEHPEWGEPSITLTEAGLVSSEWRTRGDGAISITFLPGDRIAYAAISAPAVRRWAHDRKASHIEHRGPWSETRGGEAARSARVRGRDRRVAPEAAAGRPGKRRATDRRRPRRERRGVTIADIVIASIAYSAVAAAATAAVRVAKIREQELGAYQKAGAGELPKAAMAAWAAGYVAGAAIMSFLPGGDAGNAAWPLQAGGHLAARPS